MLQVEGLHRPGLAPVSLQIDDGACLALMGPSGAGKTLLLRAIADLDPNDGEVRATGGLVRADTPAPGWRRRVAYVPAEPGWWADTVGEHFDRPAQATALLDALGLPAEALSWPVARLSTGERARLALARALVAGPPVLLLDEPTAALDGEAAARVERLLRARLADGASVLLVTHDRALAGRLGGRILWLREGRLAADAPGGAP